MRTLHQPTHHARNHPQAPFPPRVRQLFRAAQKLVPLQYSTRKRFKVQVLSQDSHVAVVNKPGFLLTTSMDDKLFGFLGMGCGEEKLPALLVQSTELE